MNTGKLDIIFKMGVLIFALVFLILFYFSMHNQRYQYQKVDFSDCKNIVFDSKTGAIYTLVVDKETGDGTEWRKLSPFEKIEHIPFK